MGPSQCPDACALTCTAQTMTSSLLVVVLSTLMVAAPLVTIECTTHRHRTSATQRSSFSSEIIIVNSELTISFFTETFSKWPPPPTTTTLTSLFPASQAQTFRSGNRRWGTMSSLSASGALLPVLLAAHSLWKQFLWLPPQLKHSCRLHGKIIWSRCRA